ncbi:MAG: DUF523 domain-containing protein [Deltaproteobacteria bacterium]|nr:DUF523 domain-containing protein [Deltaproteobacteria bacterium]
MGEKIKIGVSRCLLGDKVRYDGGDKQDPFITDILSSYIEWVPVCPEVEYGLGVPREAMHLEGNPADPRLITIHTKIDHTDRMKVWVRNRCINLEKENLCGFIFKSGSPSCGMEGVEVYGDEGESLGTGAGLFAQEFKACFPFLPVEDEERLHDPLVREIFMDRIFW